MAVTSVTILSPGDSTVSPRSLRPVTTLEWVGGTGPFDVLYEWDTNVAFNTGALVSDLNTGLTGTTDEGVPPSDLGPAGTTWYLRATITDTADAGTDEVQSVFNDATGGTFALSFDGQGPTGELDYNSAPNVSVAAEGSLTMDTQPSDGDTYTIDTKTYTFQTTLTNVDGNVAIGGSLAQAQANLVAAIDLSGVAGTDYATAMTAHGSVDVAAFAANVAVLTAQTAGKAGNSIATTETFTAGTNVFDAATLGTTTLGNNGTVTELEALSNITDVTVSGTGTVGDPYIVTFVDPGDQDVAMMTANDTNLTGHTVGTTIAEDTAGAPPTGTVAPGAPGYYIIDFTDPDDHARFLYLNANVGVGFGTDGQGDGDPDLFNRHFYLNTNVGVAFYDGGADGDPDLFTRYLYLNANVDALQPCPYLQSIAPTLVDTGDVLTLKGDSFGVLQSTYATEVRLYDTQDLLGTYTVMSSVISWNDTEITVTVPPGSSSGWVAVVHTNVGATCDGSSLRLLQIIQTPAVDEMGWLIKAVDKVNNATLESTLLPKHIMQATFKKTMNAIGSGMIELPLDDDETESDVLAMLDPLMRTGTLLRTYINDRMRYGFYAEKLSHGVDEDGNGVARITGRGMEVQALWNKILPHDHPASPSKNPTWVYGSNETFVINGGFDDAADNPVLQNPDGEDGNDSDGNAEGWSARGADLTSYAGVKDSLLARTGDWYIEVDAFGNHSGIEQSITVIPNRVYHVRTYVKDPTAAGMRVTLALGGADDIAVIGTAYANNYYYQGEVIAELDNVPQNALKNGCPGGATDGTWQVMDVEVQTGNEQTTLTIAIQDDHHPACADEVHTPFWVDDVEIEGWGLGLAPWVTFDPTVHAADSFRLQSSQTLDASPFGLYLDGDSSFAGIEQTIAINPLTKYTASIWVHSTGPAVGDYYKLEIWDADLNTLIDETVEKAPVDGVWTEYKLVFTGSSTIENIKFRFVYSGLNNPPPAYIDNARMVPGEPASTAGVILNAVLDKMATGNKLLFLNRTFTDDEDSKGEAWPSTLSLDIAAGESLYGLLSRLVALGHEWEIVPSNFATGGDTGFELNVYTGRPFAPTSGIGVSHLNDLFGPVLTTGDATFAGLVVKTAFNVNQVMAIGDNGIWSQVMQFPFEDADIPVWDPAPHGYKDSYGIVEDVVNVQASDSTTIAQFAEARLADEKAKESTLQISMLNTSRVRPFLHFGVGDSLFLDMPPHYPDTPDDAGDRSYPKRVRAIGATLSGAGLAIVFKIDIDKVIFEDEFSWQAIIAQLAERAPADNYSVGTGSVGSAGQIATSSINSTTVEAGPHTHNLGSTDITNKSTSGDVVGTLPGPLAVNKFKGIPFDTEVPVGADLLALYYSRDTKQFYFATGTPAGDTDGDTLVWNADVGTLDGPQYAGAMPTITGFGKGFGAYDNVWPGEAGLVRIDVDDGYVHLDFGDGNPQQFGEVFVNCSHPSKYPTAIKVTASDDLSTWFEVFDVAGLTAGGIDRQLTFADKTQNRRYWRVIFPTNVGGAEVDNFRFFTSSTTAGLGWITDRDVEVMTHRISGAQTVHSDGFRWYAPYDLKLLAVETSLGTAPTDADHIVDVNNGAGTIFTNSGNRPTIASAGFVSGDALPNVTVLADGDYLQFDVDQIGSTIAGSDLTITVRYTKDSP